MTHRFGGHEFLGGGGRLPVAAALSIVLALGACTTASIDDVAPVAPLAASVPQPSPRPDETAVAEQALLPVEPAAEPADPTGSARTTGEFPNLNVLPGTAAAQITPEEKAVMLGELRAKQAGVAAAAARAKPADQVQNLRKLGASHAKDALEDIEKKAE